jgi:hypothetical protein
MMGAKKPTVGPTRRILVRDFLQYQCKGIELTDSLAYPTCGEKV